MVDIAAKASDNRADYLPKPRKVAAMNELLDKMLILLFCLVFYVQSTTDQYVIVPIILVLTCSALGTALPGSSWRLALLVVFTGLCFPFSGLLFFIPVIAYDVLMDRYQWITSLLIIPLLFHYSHFTPINLLMIAAFTALSGLMKYRSHSSEQIHHEYITLRDRAAEFSMQLEEKNRELLERQDYEIKLATLQERNRIAREIHDNVGHLLSSSILQTGALLANCRDESLKENLGTLNATLSTGMNSIRESIHDLHDDSLDLENEIASLAAGFKFCHIRLDYDIAVSPGKEIKYAFISIVKEGLSNIIKHSKANDVHITLREHPGFYQLVISDNGSIQAIKQDEGIGLKNIMSRVNSLGGNINISNNNGFTLFISVPKEQ